MWTDEIVKLRFIEAADIERRMLMGGVGGSTAWPAYYHDEEDRAGWDDQAMDDALERWQMRKVTKSAELTRWEEVFFEWTSMVPEARRLIVWRWAQCCATKGSFSEWCQRKGINRRTAYKRLDKVFADLATRFRFEGRSLRMPDEKWGSQPQAEMAPSDHTMATRDARAKRAKTPTSYQAEKSCDTLTTPAAVDAFTKHLADVNAERRKARLRKSLRGVPGEPADHDTEAA